MCPKYLTFNTNFDIKCSVQMTWTRHVWIRRNYIFYFVWVQWMISFSIIFFPQCLWYYGFKKWKCKKVLTPLCISQQYSHIGSNFFLIAVARAISNSSKNHIFLMSRIWKMGRNLISSLAIKDNLKVAYLDKNSNNVW